MGRFRFRRYVRSTRNSTPTRPPRRCATRHVPADPVHIEQNVLIIAIDGRLALFDCGCGSSGVFGSATGRLLRSLAEFGVSPADIDYLVLSHAHSDHCWGAADDSGAPTFPNARIFLSRAEFEFWAQRDPNDP